MSYTKIAWNQVKEIKSKGNELQERLNGGDNSQVQSEQDQQKYCLPLLCALRVTLTILLLFVTESNNT